MQLKIKTREAILFTLIGMLGGIIIGMVVMKALDMMAVVNYIQAIDNIQFGDMIVQINETRLVEAMNETFGDSK